MVQLWFRKFNLRPIASNRVRSLVETYQAARQRLLREFAAMNFKTSKPDLKVPWVEFPLSNGKIKLYFKPQAMYLLGHSLFLDMRGMSAQDILARIRREVGA